MTQSHRISHLRSERGALDRRLIRYLLELVHEFVSDTTLPRGPASSTLDHIPETIDSGFLETLAQTMEECRAQSLCFDIATIMDLKNHWQRSASAIERDLATVEQLPAPERQALLNDAAVALDEFIQRRETGAGVMMAHTQSAIVYSALGHFEKALSILYQSCHRFADRVHPRVVLATYLAYYEQNPHVCVDYLEDSLTLQEQQLQRLKSYHERVGESAAELRAKPLHAALLNWYEELSQEEGYEGLEKKHRAAITSMKNNIAFNLALIMRNEQRAMDLVADVLDSGECLPNYFHTAGVVHLWCGEASMCRLRITQAIEFFDEAERTCRPGSVLDPEEFLRRVSRDRDVARRALHELWPLTDRARGSASSTDITR
jgi:hypothetical protein